MRGASLDWFGVVEMIEAEGLLSPGCALQMPGYFGTGPRCTDYWLSSI